MPVPFFIPPWLSPPDPVATYQRGVQIGAQIGETQARQRLTAESAAREQQQREYEATLAEQRIQLAASEAARRTQAQLRFRANVAGGMDPMEALMQSPEIMQEGAPLAQMMRAEQARKAAENFQPSIVDIGQGQQAARLGPSHYQLVAPQMPESTQAVPITDPTGRTVALRYGNRIISMQRESEAGELTQQQRAELSALRAEEARLQKQYAQYNDPMMGDRMRSKASPATQARIREADRQIERIRKRILELTRPDLAVGETGEPDDETNAPPVEAAAPEVVAVPRVKSIKRLR